MAWMYPYRVEDSRWISPTITHPFRRLPEMYRYEPLGASHMIRLLLLHPGQATGPIECSLFHCSLYTCPVYTALSYVWGDSSNQQLLVLNGRLLEINHNLHVALNHLRKPNEPIILWVDAICINQADLAERSAQVVMMRTIYESAESVIAWIGESTGESDLAMAYIADFTGSESDIDKMRKIGKEQASETWTALCNLWSRPYWERVWVIQEIAVARKAHILCGTLVISLDALERILLAVRKYVLDRFALSARRPIRLLRMRQVDQKPDIAQILHNTTHCKATDSRDRVYGIIGIAPMAYRAEIIPDYSKSLGKVVRDVMIAYVHLESDLNIFCYFKAHLSDSEGHVPSWVPDITRQESGLPPYQYSCSAGRPSSARFLDNRNTLALKGLVIGKIDVTKGPFRASIDIDENEARNAHDERENLSEMKDLSLLALKRNYSDSEGHNDESRYKRFWTMLTGDRGYSGPLCPYSCQELWDFLIFKEKNYPRDTDMRKYAAFMFYRLLDRCFFTTLEGQIGLGPDKVQSGDLICIFFGSSLCTIVRERGDHQVYVGPAYVDGAMDGAYIRRLEEGFENSPKVVDFVLR